MKEDEFHIVKYYFALIKSTHHLENMDKGMPKSFQKWIDILSKNINPAFSNSEIKSAISQAAITSMETIRLTMIQHYKSIIENSKENLRYLLANWSTSDCFRLYYRAVNWAKQQLKRLRPETITLCKPFQNQYTNRNKIINNQMQRTDQKEPMRSDNLQGIQRSYKQALTSRKNQYFKRNNTLNVDTTKDKHKKKTLPMENIGQSSTSRYRDNMEGQTSTSGHNDTIEKTKTQKSVDLDSENIETRNQEEMTNSTMKSDSNKSMPVNNNSIIFRIPQLPKTSKQRTTNGNKDENPGFVVRSRSLSLRRSTKRNRETQEEDQDISLQRVQPARVSKASANTFTYKDANQQRRKRFSSTSRLTQQVYTTPGALAEMISNLQGPEEYTISISDTRVCENDILQIIDYMFYCGGLVSFFNATFDIIRLPIKNIKKVIIQVSNDNSGLEKCSINLVLEHMMNSCKRVFPNAVIFVIVPFVNDFLNEKEKEILSIIVNIFQNDLRNVCIPIFPPEETIYLDYRTMSDLSKVNFNNNLKSFLN